MRARGLTNSLEGPHLNSEIVSLESEASATSSLGSIQARQHLEQVVRFLYDRLHASLSELQKKEAGDLHNQMSLRRHFRPAAHAMAAAATLSGEHLRLHSPRISNTPQDAETSMLLASYASDLDEIVALQRRLGETAAVLEILSLKVAEQSEQAVSILGAAEAGRSAIENAEDQFKKAARNESGWKFWVVIWFITAGCVLIFLDLFC